MIVANIQCSRATSKLVLHALLLVIVVNQALAAGFFPQQRLELNNAFQKLHTDSSQASQITALLKTFKQTEGFFTPLCADTTATNKKRVDACLLLCISLAGKGQALFSLGHIANAYQAFEQSFTTLDKAEQLQIDLQNSANSLTPKPNPSQEWLNAYRRENEHRLKKQLPEKFSNNQLQTRLDQLQKQLDSQRKQPHAIDRQEIMAKIDQRTDIPEDMKLIVNQIASQQLDQLLGTFTTQAATRARDLTKLEDQTFLGELLPLFNRVSSHLCIDPNLKIKEQFAKDVKAGKSPAGQVNFFAESKKRFEILLGTDEASSLQIGDVMQLSTLKALVKYSDIHQQPYVGKSQATGLLAASIKNCGTLINATLELGLAKVLLDEGVDQDVYQQLNTLSERSRQGLNPGISIKGIGLAKVKMGSKLFKDGKQQQGMDLMHEGISALTALPGSGGMVNFTFFDSIEGLLMLAATACSDNFNQSAHCDSAISIANKKTKSILDMQNAIYAMQQWIKPTIKGSIGDSERSQFASLTWGIQARQREIFEKRTTELGFAELYFQLGDLTKAKHYLNGQHQDIVALHPKRNELFPELLLAYEFYLEAKSHQSQGRQKEASLYFKKSIEQYDEWMPLWGILFQVPNLFSTATSLYEEAAYSALSNGQYDIAFSYLEKARNYSLIQRKLPPSYDPKKLVELKAQLLQHYTNLVTRHTKDNKALAHQLAAARQQNRLSFPGGHELINLPNLLSFLPNLQDHEKLAFLKLYDRYTTYVTYQELSHILGVSAVGATQANAYRNQSATLNKIMHALPEKTLLLGYWETHEGLFFYSISSRKKVFRYHPGSIAFLSDQQFAQQFLLPLIQEDIDTLVVVANGSIRSRVFANLPLNKKTNKPHLKLVDRWRLIHAPTAMKAVATATQLSKQHSALLVAPRFDVLPQLSHQQEKVALTQIGSVQTIHNYDKRELVNTLSQYSIIHFSTHAKLDPLAPQASYILLNQQQSKLFNHEIRALDLHNVDLVVLNACETATVSTALLRNEFSSFQESFLAAGVKAVIGTLRRVDDQVAEDFSRYFYHELSEGHTLTNAFHKAQLSLKDKYPNTDQWGIFTLSGSINTLESSL
ncbi:MAG: CHAT domain-containing protein [Pseudomonadales bacterium]|nr:CHAT domain-containing protein [Pseudomonadales bacterium]